MSALVSRIVALCAAQAWLVILASLLAGGLAVDYAARHFAMDTDSLKLISAELPFRKREAVFDAAFPQRVDLILVVIDGATPELAETATARLAAELAPRRDLFRVVRRPDDADGFFARNGLLFLDLPEVQATTEQLIQAQPLLGPLAADPSLRGVMGALDTVLLGVKQGATGLEPVQPALAALADTAAELQAGRPAFLSWRALVTGAKPSMRELRRFVFVQPVMDYSALQPGAAATDAIRAAAQKLGLTPEQGVRLRLTGPVPLSDEEFATVADGAALDGLLTVVAVIVLLWLALHSVRLIVAILLSLAVGLAITAAFGLAAVGSFNLISVAFAVLSVGLGIDFGIQFAIRYRAERHVYGDLKGALASAGAGVGRPLAIAAASTAAGFFALTPTDFRGVSELGLIAGVGMLVAFLLSITMLPALIRVMRPSGELAEVGIARLAGADGWVQERRRRLLLGFGAAGLVGLALLPRLDFDFNPMNLRSEKTESLSTLLDLVKDPDTNPNTIDVLAASLQEADARAARLGALPEVERAMTLSSFVPEGQDEKLAYISDAALLLDPTLNPATVANAPSDAEVAAAMKATAARLQEVSGSGAAGSTPGSAPGMAEAQRLAGALQALAAGPPAARAAYAQALVPGLKTLLGMLRTSLQAAPVTPDSLPAALVRDWVAPDGRARIEVYPKGDPNDNAVLARFVAAARTLEPEAGGAPVSIMESGRAIVGSFLEAGLWAFLSITLLLALVLRRADDVLRTLAPLLLSGVLTLGLCAGLGLPLNFANIIALPLLFGIGVAFNIYYVMAWRAGSDRLLGSSLTRAVLFSALATGTAFGSLWLSNHPGTASMGRLLALSLAFTLLTALVFLPALLGPAPRGQSR